MTDPHFPLPADADLAPETLEVLRALPPLNIFRALAALPASLGPFLELGGSILAGTHLTAKERELAILRVAHLTAASYERHQHEQLARSVGMTEAEIEATAARSPDHALGPDADLVLRATDEITRDIRLSDGALAQIRERWGDRGAAELILTVSYYNMVSRFLESTRVPIETEDLLAETTPQKIVREGRASTHWTTEQTD